MDPPERSAWPDQPVPLAHPGQKAMSAQALVMRVTGFNAMLGSIYDFIGRTPPDPDDEK